MRPQRGVSQEKQAGGVLETRNYEVKSVLEREKAGGYKPEGQPA